MSHQDPNAREHRPFALDGEYPGAEQYEQEQVEREHAAKFESGPMYGSHPVYPDRAMPRSPEMYEKEMEHAAKLRACHGGLPDSSDENPSIAVAGGKPFAV